MARAGSRQRARADPLAEVVGVVSGVIVSILAATVQRLHEIFFGLAPGRDSRQSVTLIRCRYCSFRPSEAWSCRRYSVGIALALAQTRPRRSDRGERGPRRPAIADR